MINSTMKWQIDPAQAFDNINAGIRNRALRIAINAAASPVKAAVIATAPKDTGNLAKATKIKVKNYKNNNAWVAIIGAGTKFKRLRRGKRKKGQKKSYIIPAKYQHLVDRKKHYLSASFQKSRQQFQQIAMAKLKEVIEQLMRQK